jgi:hypothetical protein
MKLQTRADDYLGGIIGRDRKEMAERLQQKVTGIVEQAKLCICPGYLSAQQSLLLIKHCVITKFSHFLRKCEPQVTRQAAERFDNEMARLFCQLADIAEAEVTPAVRNLMFGPASLGFRGLQSMADEVDIGYLGAQALCAPTLQKVLADEKKGSQHRQALQEALAGARRLIGEGATAEHLPLTINEDNFIAHFAHDDHRKDARKLKKALTAAVHANRFSQIEKDAKTPEQKAHLNTIIAKGATLMSTTVPLQRELQLPDPAFVLFHRKALGLGPKRVMPLHCRCCAPNGQFSSDPNHALSCQAALSGPVTWRHDNLKYLLADLAHKVGATDVKVEPTRLDPEKGRRDHPDLSYWLEGELCWVDCTVRRACAPSHVRVSSKSLKQFMDEAAAEKHRHYDDMATKAGATFVAFVVESNGGFGDEALQHLKKMIQAAQRQSYVWAPAQAINTVYRAIAARLAIDNHLIVAENLQWNEGGGRWQDDDGRWAKRRRV